MASGSLEEARALLKKALGPDADFRDGQWEAIEPLLQPANRLLVVQRTGWGKSVVYFLATRLLRDRGHGPTLLVSPLLALMRNQIELATKFGVRAATINSSNREEWDAVLHEVDGDRLDLLLVSPERLGNFEFRTQTLGALEQRTGLLVIDEAHCISDWGHDFRPDYRRILSTVQRLRPETPILATTATANDRVIADIKEQLGDRLKISRGTLLRESLRIRALELGDQAERLAWLARYVPKLPGTGIIYTSTVNDALRVAEWLRLKGLAAAAYHGSVDKEERLALEADFREDRLKVLVATTALGMGYDKGNVAFVIHFQRPGSIIAYYQQIGRAGRNIPKAEVVLLTGVEDDQIVEHFIETAFPGKDCFEETLQAVKAGASTADAVTARTNFRRGQIEKALQLLEVEEAIVKNGRKYDVLRPDWNYEALKADQITAQRRAELEQMRAYTKSDDCRMAFLARSLDVELAEPCGKCDRCKPLEWPPLNPADVAAAVEFLRGGFQRIGVKAMWPAGFLDEGRKKIPEGERLEPGAALCVYGDAGWGRLVRAGKYESGRFSDELLEPAAAALRRLGIVPEWITWVPTLKQNNLVEDFARRLAVHMGIEAVPAARKLKQNQEQKLMQNSSTQLQNVWDSFEVIATRPGVGILFDDVIDSGWTMASIAAKLRTQGSGPIVPFALASARPRDDS